MQVAHSVLNSISALTSQGHWGRRFIVPQSEPHASRLSFYCPLRAQPCMQASPGSLAAREWTEAKPNVWRSARPSASF